MRYNVKWIFSILRRALTSPCLRQTKRRDLLWKTRIICCLNQKNRWGLTVLSVVICLMLSPMLALSAFLPQIVTLVPVMLMLLLGYVGPASAAACTAVIVSVSSAIMGVWGGMLSMLLLVPVVIVGAYMVEKDSPF